MSLLIAAPEAERDELMAQLMDAGTAGCIEEPAGLRAFFADNMAARLLQVPFPILEIREEPAEASFEQPDELGEPILVANRFFVVPRSADYATPKGCLRLEVEAGSAFGTGRHESTQLMLEALGERLRPGMTVADVGCGSGILSQAAILLGAKRVVACDIDPVFLGCVPDELRERVFTGSADGLRTYSVDLVLANISAKVIDAIAYDLNRITKVNGILILSGFIQEHPPERFSPIDEMSSGDWLCWVCKPEASQDEQPASGTLHSLEWY